MKLSPICLAVVWLFQFDGFSAGTLAQFASQITLATDDPMRAINPAQPAAMPINEERVAAAGIRKIKSKHLTLYTDVRDRADIDELPTVFDAAVPQWCRLFSIDPARAEPWRMHAFVIEEAERFRAAGLIPADLPDFPAGYQRGHEMWVYLQPGNFYTRHLLLHEGTHGVMAWFLNGMGSPWYTEGMAELVGLHRWDPSGQTLTEKLQLQYRVRDRSECDHWGRVKILREDWAAGKVYSLDEALRFPGISFRDVKSYAWAWAACEFLSGHELSKKTFAEMIEHVRLPAAQFDAKIRQPLAREWPQLERDWQLFLSEMDYGYQVQRGQLTQAEQTVTTGAKLTVTIRADFGWQTVELAVKQGQQFRVQSTSQYVVGKTGEQLWRCEPNGITLEYYRGQPLGMLLAGVVGDVAELRADGKRASEKIDVAGLLRPHLVGRDSIIEIEHDGKLCLRINESPAKLDDNQGVLEVTIEKLE